MTTLEMDLCIFRIKRASTIFFGIIVFAFVIIAWFLVNSNLNQRVMDLIFLFMFIFTIGISLPIANLRDKVINHRNEFNYYYYTRDDIMKNIIDYAKIDSWTIENVVEEVKKKFGAIAIHNVTVKLVPEGISQNDLEQMKVNAKEKQQILIKKHEELKAPEPSKTVAWAIKHFS